MNVTDFVTKHRVEILLAGILILSGFLNLWNIWNQGNTNYYYAAAVKSMLVNPGIGFFNSFDPAGFITIDKSPVGLWVQAAFAAVLGFSGWILVLPQALAGIGSVALIYFIISRPFGKPAGLVAALALAVTPIFVAISRNGTMDTQMIFVLLLAVWVVLKATRERSLPWFLASVVLIGIGFNIKMIQAFIVVPAVLAVYFLGTTDVAWKKRILHVGLAVVVLLAVSLSWAVAVDMVPTDQRPYIGGSGDNTVLGLIINYNGLHRLGIDDMSGSSVTGGPGTSASGMPGQGQNRSIMAVAGQMGSTFPGPGGSQGTYGSTPGAPPSGMTFSGEGQQPAFSGMQPPGSSGLISGSAPGGGGGMNSGGSPSIFRVFGNGLAGDISWLLAFALIGVLAWVRRPNALSLKGFEEAGFMSERGLILIAMLLWFIPGFLYFSFTTGFWHDYYIATIAPPIAGLVGIGAAGLYRKYVTSSRMGWLLVIAVLVTGLLQTMFLSYDAEWSGPLVPLVLLGTLACTGLLAWIQVRKSPVLINHKTRIIAVTLGILFISPLVWSCTPIMNGNGGTIPTAGPQSSRGGGMNSGMTGDSLLSGVVGPGNRSYNTAAAGGFLGSQTSGVSVIGGGPQGMGGEGASTSQLAAYLLAHSTNETWILAVPNAQAGGDLISETGKPVMCLGGFMGSDQVLNLTTLQDYIREGKVRYFETGGANGGGMGGGNSEIFSWVSSHCTAVPESEWGESTDTVAPAVNGMSGQVSQNTLYDCAGSG
jgi:4-amino-4-deoxy-L-arabinose transferase-like glycosyltransferase